MRGQSAMEYLMNYWWAVLLALMVGTVLWKLGIPGIGSELTSKGEALKTSISTTLSPMDGGVAVVAGEDVSYFVLNLKNKAPSQVELLPKSSRITVMEQELLVMPTSRLWIVPPDGQLRLLALLDQPLLSPGGEIEFDVESAYLDVESRTPHLETYSLKEGVSPLISSLEMEADAEFNRTLADSFKVNGTVSGASQRPVVAVAILQRGEAWELLETSTARVSEEGGNYEFYFTTSSFSVGELDTNEDGSTFDEFETGEYAVRVVATDDYGSFGFLQGSAWEGEQNFTLSLTAEPLE